MPRTSIREEAPVREAVNDPSGRPDIGANAATGELLQQSVHRQAAHALHGHSDVAALRVSVATALLNALQRSRDR
jgi:hypothetical protein